MLDTNAEIAGYSGAIAASSARSFLSSVDAMPTSLATAIAPATLESSVAAVTPPTPVIPIVPTPPAALAYALTVSNAMDALAHNYIVVPE